MRRVFGNPGWPIKAQPDRGKVRVLFMSAGAVTAMTETDSLSQILDFLLALVEAILPYLSAIFSPMLSAGILSFLL